MRSTVYPRSSQRSTTSPLPKEITTEVPTEAPQNYVQRATMMNSSDLQGTQQQLKEASYSIAPRQSTKADRKKRRPQTFGFPPLRTESKRVTFSQPLYARCVALDESWSTDCQVLSVWNDGARLAARNPKDLTSFFLIFVSSPKPVFRRCKRVWVRGNEIEVSYERQPPCFGLERNPLDEAPSGLLDR